MRDKPYKIIVTDFIADSLTPENKILGEQASIKALNAFDENELVGQIEDADAIMLYHNLSISRKTLEKLTQCKLIVRCGVGYDNVDHLFARERGIPVSNVPDYGTEEVADSAIGMMLSLTRGIHYLNDRLRSQHGPWSYTQIQPLKRLREQVFGIVGLGRIGTAAALRAKALGMRVLFYDPDKPDGCDKMLGVQRANSLHELLEQSFVLSMHCPRTEQTQHMIGSAEIALMPKGAYLVNTARGGVVDVTALPEALASGQLAGAAIDVLETEPPKDDDPLLLAWRDPKHPAHHRLILNPHSAFYCEEGLTEMRVKGSVACLNALNNRPIRNVIN